VRGGRSKGIKLKAGKGIGRRGTSDGLLEPFCHYDKKKMRDRIPIGNTERGVDQYFFSIVIITSLDSLQF